MFCKNCGQTLPEGKAFCTNCGAPAGQASETIAPSVASAPAGTSAPAGPSAKPRRTGLMVGAVVAALIVVAAAGVGIWLALRGDDGSGQAAAGDGAPTAMTVPGDEGSAIGAGSEVTESLDPTVAAYRTAVENVLRELDFDHGRIPELADIINANLPDVPQPVYDDLQLMADRLGPARSALLAVAVPAGYEEANDYLVDAASHMTNRIQATMAGVQAAWDAGATAPALPHFTEGREQRDAYLEAIEGYYDIIPPGSLPGDPGICDT